MKYFTDTAWGINFLILFVFSMSMQFLGYALCTAIETVKTGNSITYGLFLLGMVIQAILGNQNVIVFWWADDIALWSVFIRICL